MKGAGPGRQALVLFSQPTARMRAEPVSLRAGLRTGPFRDRGQQPGDELLLEDVSGQPYVMEPVSGCLVQLGGRHHDELVVADTRVDHPLVREGNLPSVLVSTMMRSSTDPVIPG